MGTNASSKNQQIEFDVFPKEKKQKGSYLYDAQNDTAQESTSINVIFSNQSVIVIIVCAILFLVASFSLGVEKGKLITKSENVTAPTAQISPLPLETEKKAEEAEVNKNNAQEKPVQPEVKITEEALASPKETNPKTGFTIQVASLKSKNAARELRESLIKKGIPSFTKSSGDYTIVLTGNFKKKSDAELQLKELKKTFKDCFIRKS